MILASLTAWLSACMGSTPERPGDIPNPKLAELITVSLQKEIGRMNPTWAPGLLLQGADNARAWLRSIDEVVARCRYGPNNHTKANLLEYDITLRGGEILRDVYSGQRCLYPTAPPLIMRVRFNGGSVREVLTDGRERNAPVDAAMNAVNQFAHSVVQADWRRRPTLYFSPDKTPEEIAREWRERESGR